MIKKCIGCGITLQDKDENALGFTPNIKNSYCTRCFKLKHYGVENTEKIDPKMVLKKINSKKGIVFFLLDFLNINYETINLFKSIKLPKVLVISKCDTLRKDMKYQKIEKWLKDIYHIDEDVLFISGKYLNYSNNIFKYMDNHNFKTCLITGLTNAGKSTFINSLLKENGIKKEILVSKNANTTLDFISLNIGEYKVIDTPGLLYTTYDHTLIQKEIKPISFNITSPITFIVNKTLRFRFNTPNKIIFYLTTPKIIKEYKESNDVINEIQIGDNEDFIIPGLGFINVKKETIIKTNMKYFETRKDLSGEDYE